MHSGVTPLNPLLPSNFTPIVNVCQQGAVLQEYIQLFTLPDIGREKSFTAVSQRVAPVWRFYGKRGG